MEEMILSRNPLRRKERGVGFHMAIFFGSCVLSDCTPTLWWLITWREVGSRYMMLLE